MSPLVGTSYDVKDNAVRGQCPVTARPTHHNAESKANAYERMRARAAPAMRASVSALKRAATFRT
jgi:hypothetical protein